MDTEQELRERVAALETALTDLQWNRDQEHLRVLSIVHYVLGGASILFGSIPLIHVAVGLFLALSPIPCPTEGPSPALFGWIFAGVGTLVVLIGWTFGALQILVGRRLTAHRSYILCVVVACLEMLSIPFGTAAGVFTVLVLNRDAVKRAFGQG